MAFEKDFMKQSLAYLKGVGPSKAELIAKELQIFNVSDFLMHFPFRYEDRTQIHKASEAASYTEVYIQLYGKIVPVGTQGEGKSKRLIAKFTDSSGTVELVWFQGIKWVAESLKPGASYLVYGRPQLFNNKISIAHPELEQTESTAHLSRRGFVPVYPLTETLRKRYVDQKVFNKIAEQIFNHPEYRVAETLSESILEENKFQRLDVALRNVHLPQNAEALKAATDRIKFEEFFYLQLRNCLIKENHKKNSKGFVFEKVGELFNDFYHHHLPFELTGAQKNVIREIRQDMKNGRQMNRLLQGDVGSGKTIVALLCMLLAVDNGYQACLMAPTEILATQHFFTIEELLAPLNIKPVLLTGSTRKKEREKILEQLKTGEIKILIGTHALIEADVELQNPGLIIIDEQHRFGVAQRARLREKGQQAPHVLVMTATPIPRTLAMTVYGDLDVSTIKELPGGRKPIVTAHRFDNVRQIVMDFVAAEIEKGRQVYFVFPLIEESEKLSLADLMSGVAMIQAYLPPPKYTYAVVHGKMKAADKEHEMQRFKAGKADIMVATTVIEVGVNVPNATAMVIENADRFGLAQLHQLRGRVGRGGEQSYCLLMTSHKLSKNARHRLRTMVQTNDGFEIARVDMELRGFGDIDGTRQSGELELRLADIFKDEPIMHHARKYAEQVAAADPLLMLPENAGIRHKFGSIQTRTKWSKIS